MSIKKAIELVGIYYGKALTLEYVHKKWHGLYTKYGRLLIRRKKMKRAIKELYTILWAIVMAIGLILFFEIGWLVMNW